ncbi:MAG: hypothetical protein ABSA33_01065, partial [Candidatus Micrarchaeaceae archaeon]
YKQAKVRLFHFKNRMPPIDEITAIKIGQSILSGEVIAAKAFINIDSKHNFIALIRASSKRDFDHKVYVLEQFGNSYRTIWSSTELFGRPEHLDVVDLDLDGIHEISFGNESFGTGAGTRTLYIYYLSTQTQYEITEHYNWQDASGPISPHISFTPEIASELTINIEKYAIEKGFLHNKIIDLSNPEFAPQKWHHDNGRRRSGCISLTFYKGPPSYGASIVQELEGEEIKWTAYFKGPIFGYIKALEQHFIAYSPAWIYNSAKCLAYGHGSLWFGIHLDPGFLRFVFNGESSSLFYFSHLNGYELPEVEKIGIQGQCVILNDSIEIPIQELPNREESMPSQQVGINIRIASFVPLWILPNKK